MVKENGLSAHYLSERQIRIKPMWLIEGEARLEEIKANYEANLKAAKAGHPVFVKGKLF